MTLYEGRMGNVKNDLMDAINRSLPVDLRLLPFDLMTNSAWADELEQIGVLTEDENESIQSAIQSIFDELEAGYFDSIPPDEDVHTLTERLLVEKIGAVGAKIHTGRSRNDQVVCDLRLMMMHFVKQLKQNLAETVKTLHRVAEEHKATLMAGETHLQPALPITLGQFLLSLAFGLYRDIEALDSVYEVVGVCPLGAGAMAGSGFPVDRNRLAENLGFPEASDNSVDAVSDRDFVQDLAYVISRIAVRISRYAEQFTIWANPNYGYVRFADDWSTGSSMMPQKRNPDAMELIRGKAARCIGNLTTLLTLTKGLPLSYAKDLQEDKEPLFDSMDNISLVVAVFEKAVGSATFNPDAMKQRLDGNMLATDLADALTKTGMPFREAHKRVGQLVSKLENEGRKLLDATEKELTLQFPEFKGKLPELSFEASIEARDVLGGTAPSRVQEQLNLLNVYLKNLE